MYFQDNARLIRVDYRFGVGITLKIFLGNLSVYVGISTSLFLFLSSSSSEFIYLFDDKQYKYNSLSKKEKIYTVLLLNKLHIFLSEYKLKFMSCL
jgi:hypothetical protein